MMTKQIQNDATFSQVYIEEFSKILKIFQEHISNSASETINFKSQFFFKVNYFTKGVFAEHPLTSREIAWVSIFSRFESLPVLSKISRFFEHKNP